MKTSNYMNRAMTARDPRFKEILGKLGYERIDIQSGTEIKKSNDLAHLRSEYHKRFGKRAPRGWSADEIATSLGEVKGDD